jgi:hypothetical protein
LPGISSSRSWNNAAVVQRMPVSGWAKPAPQLRAALARNVPPFGYALFALLASVLYPVAGEAVADQPSIEVVGTSFQVTIPDGRLLLSSDLIGAVLDVVDEAGRTVTLRIDAVGKDPSDPGGEIWLHRFSVADDSGSGWREFCTPGPDGTVAGFPIAGSWASDGRHEKASAGFIVTCTSGAVGKCVRMGYKPWREVEGESLWEYHQSCVRALRADYGGDGAGYTRNGTLVDVFDRLGIQSPEPDPHDPTLQFEAAWGPNGAVCVRRTRLPEILTTDQLAERYPHLTDRIGPDCSEATAALIWNRS